MRETFQGGAGTDRSSQTMKKEPTMPAVLHRTFPPFLLGAAIAVLVLSAAAPARAEDDPFLQRFRTVLTVASTLPPNQDVNPYGIALVERSVGSLRRGSVLVSNFNDAANLQGTGTTIVQIDTDGRATLFAQIDAAKLPGSCPGGVGLTTALVVLTRGWVIVGSLPSATGQSADAEAGCLIVLDSGGAVVETLHGGGINGPWDMTALDDGDRALLFVSNVLNGDVTSGDPHVVKGGTVLRIGLEVPEPGGGRPRRESTTIIGSGFSETADPAALVIGPTGVGLSWDGTLYVADTLNNRIAAIPEASTRTTSMLTGMTVAQGGALNAPLGLALAPNGDILTANAGDGNLVETTPGGVQVAVKTVDTATGAGSLFGLVPAPRGHGLYFVDDGDNTLKELIR
jgi:hypothetical protein